MKAPSPPAIHPALQDFPSLRILDLSFNALPSLHAVLHNLAPLGGAAGGLHKLRLNDNPLAGGPPQPGRPGQGGAGGHDPADGAAPAGYQRAVLQVLPQLRELDSQPVDDAERRLLLQAAGRRSRAAAGAVVGPDAGAAGAGGGPERQARTVLCLLTQPGALELLEESEAQQQALAAANFLNQVAGPPACAPGAAGAAAALAGLEQAATCGPFTGQQRSSSSMAAAPRGGGGWAPVQPLRRAQQLYLLLARGDVGAAEDLLWLNTQHYQELLGRLHRAATRLQAAWRRLCAIRLRQRLAAEQRASTLSAAAACVQAAWRGWVCRQRSHTHVQARLFAWRQEWQAAEQLVAEHRRSGAAVRIQVRQAYSQQVMEDCSPCGTAAIGYALPNPSTLRLLLQAAWRGWRVRRLLAQMRQSLQHPGQALPGSPGQQVDWELGSDLSTSSLDGLLEGGASSLLRAFEAPEALLPGLAPAAVADGSHGAVSVLHHCGHPGSGGSDRGGGGSTGCWPSAASPAKAPLQLPQLSAAKPCPATSPGTDSSWQFDDPATAAAFMQLRQRSLQQQRQALAPAAAARPCGSAARVSRAQRAGLAGLFIGLLPPAAEQGQQRQQLGRATRRPERERLRHPSVAEVAAGSASGTAGCRGRAHR